MHRLRKDIQQEKHEWLTQSSQESSESSVLWAVWRLCTHEVLGQEIYLFFIALRHEMPQLPGSTPTPDASRNFCMHRALARHNSAVKPKEMSAALFRLPPIFEKTGIPASPNGNADVRAQSLMSITSSHAWAKLGRGSKPLCLQTRWWRRPSRQM